jgi:hypothetical protein
MMPVMQGRTEPPKKRSSQSKIRKIQKLSKNAIGVAARRHRNETIFVILRANFELYPPTYAVTFPPTTTPRTGPVMLTMAKEMKTVF